MADRIRKEKRGGRRDMRRQSTVDTYSKSLEQQRRLIASSRDSDTSDSESSEGWDEIEAGSVCTNQLILKNELNSS